MNSWMVEPIMQRSGGHLCRLVGEEIFLWNPALNQASGQVTYIASQLAVFISQSHIKNFSDSYPNRKLWYCPG